MRAGSGEGLVAAGHPITAEAGAAVLREGGNAVDAAIAAMLASFVAEPLLTGLGAGGYMLVAEPDGEHVLLDFFVETPGRRGDAADLVAIAVSFGDALQEFHIGPASCGVYGLPHGICTAAARFGTVPLADLAAPAVELARDGLVVNEQQAYLFDLLTPIARPAQRMFGGVPRAGDLLRLPELGDGIERLGAEGSAPFYSGDIARAVADATQGGVALEDLAAYETVEREPVRASFRGRDVYTNPPPSAGGILIAYALALLERRTDEVTPLAVVEAMESAQSARTPEFTAGLADAGFLEDFMARHLGSTTHISVLDANGMACAVTCTNGEGSGVVVPGTGIHLNNMLGEQDLSPAGFFTHPPGRRLPSMMAPTVVLRDGTVELVLGSAGSNRIRSAILQVVLGVVEHGLDAASAIEAPRLHVEEGTVYVEPGIDASAFGSRPVVPFRAPNLFFGGVQAIRRDPGTGALSGGADPRRGGAVVRG